MFNKFKIGERVLVNGTGECDGNVYKNVPATVLRRDPYFKDYLVEFEDGTEDWILPEDLQKLYLI